MSDTVVTVQKVVHTVQVAGAAAVAVVKQQTVQVVTVGTQGPAGGGGGGGNFTHTQTLAAASWTVNHNLGYRPAIQTLTMGGVEFLGEVLHVSANQAVVYFDSPSSGLAICS